MAARHFRRNEPLTEFLFANGFLVDKKSYATLPMISKEDSHNSDGWHLVLFGEDKRRMRERIYDACGGRCVKCGRALPLYGEEGRRAEWNHRKGGLVGRCDCFDNGEILCGRFLSDCHTEEHVAPQFSRKVKL